MNNRRKNYFIKRKFQAKFILRFCFLMVLGFVISAACLYITSQSSMTTSFVNSRLSIVRTADYLLPAILWISLATLFLIGIVTAVAVMYISHRIAGAMFNIERKIENIRQGDLTSGVKLRSTDEAQEMAESINSMLSAFKAQILKIREVSSEIDRQMEGLNIKELKELADKKRELNRLIDYFKTS